MQKKIIAAAALVLALTLLFVACGKGPTIVTKEGNEYPLMTDAEGNTVVNENGDLVIYVTDENGEYVTDANSEPQTNAVTFPDQIVDGKTIETSLYTWTLPDGWNFDDDGKAVKDGTDEKVYVKIMEAATTDCAVLPSPGSSARRNCRCPALTDSRKRTWWRMSSRSCGEY